MLNFSIFIYLDALCVCGDEEEGRGEEDRLFLCSFILPTSFNQLLCCISYSVRSWRLCCSYCTAKKQSAEPTFQTLADSLYPAPVLIAISLDPAINPHSHFSCRRKVFHTHPADYRRIRIIEPHLGGGSHRLKRNACLIEPRCKTSKIPNLIGFRITASALLVISS